jgi:hypothetical protein
MTNVLEPHKQQRCRHTNEIAATVVLPADWRERLPRFFDPAQWLLERHPHTATVLTVWRAIRRLRARAATPGRQNRRTSGHVDNSLPAMADIQPGAGTR